MNSYWFVVLFPHGSNVRSYPALLSGAIEGKGQQSIFPVGYFPVRISFSVSRNTNIGTKMGVVKPT